MKVGARRRKDLNRWYIPLVNWLLRSPFHWLMDGGTLLLTYTGRKSGRSFTFPISYAQNGQLLRLITRPQKTWWKSLGAGAPVTLWLRGKKRTGQAQVVPLARDARLAALFNVYRGMPRRLAEQQVDNAIVIANQLDDAQDRPNINAVAAVVKRTHNIDPQKARD